MCRLAAHLGDPVPLSSLLYDPPHALQDMAYAPRELQHGTVNVDGTGVAWWDDIAPSPLRYVTTDPPWSDANLPALSQRLHGHAILAAVRGATPGIAYGPGNVAPFVADGLAFAHNGWLGSYRDGVRRDLEADLSDRVHALGTAVSDSLTLFQVLLDAYATDGDLERAVVGTLRRAVRVCAAHDAPATLNLLVCDGRRVVASRAHRGLRGNSLYVAEDAAGCWLASEPLDDERAWRHVDDDQLVVMDDSGITLTPLSDVTNGTP